MPQPRKMADLRKMKKDDLKQELQKRNVPLHPRDTKEDMIQRILTHDERMNVAPTKSSAQLTQDLKASGLSAGGDIATKQKRLAEHSQRKEAIVKAPIKSPVKSADKSLVKSPVKSPSKAPARCDIFTYDQCEEYTVVTLKEKLKELGLTTTGNKEQLVARLADHYKEGLVAKTLHDILIINKGAFTGKAKRGGEYPHAVKISFNDRMYQKFSIPPVEHQTSKGKKCPGMSVVFGPLLELDKYALHGVVDGNDVAIINYGDVGDFRNNVIYDNLFPLNKDVSVYAHHDRFGEIDSLILEQECLLI